MGSEIIRMDDIMAVYDVTDVFSIDRENISIPLEKNGDGDVQLRDEKLEIVIPATLPIYDWLPILRTRLESLGFQETENTEDDWGS